jgi:hypothetical protein
VTLEGLSTSKDYDSKGLVAKTTLVVILKGLD